MPPKRNYRPRRTITGTVAGMAGHYAMPYARRAVQALAQRLRSKAANKVSGRTATVTKRYVKTKNVSVQGNGGQITRFSAKIPPKPFDRKLMAASSNLSYYTNLGMRASVGPGKQTFYEFGAWIGGNQTAVTAAQDIVNLLSDVVGLTPNPSLSPKTTKIYLKSLQQQTRMTNQDNGNVEVLIYDIICKRDNNSLPSAHWAQGLTNESIAGATSGSVSSTAAYTLVGCKLTQSHQFNQYWRVVKKSRLILGAGQCHTHVVNLQPNRWFTYEQLSEDQAHHAGLSYYTIVVINGMPQNDATTVTQVSTGGVAMDFVTTRITHCGYVTNNKEFSYTNNNLVTAFTVNESVLEPDGDKTIQVQA